MKNFIILYLNLVIFLFFSCVNQSDKFELKNGDLLFQDMDCGPLCDAIESVTNGYNNFPISHVGIVEIEDDSIFVIEAGGKGVVKTPLRIFLNRSLDENGNPKVIVGRMNDSLKNLIPKALSFAEQYIGKPYDKKFEMNDSAFYCSELIYKIFYLANNNHPIFHLQPMSFCLSDSKTAMPVWQEYFKDLHMKVPEGKPGCNPAAFSRSKSLKIIYQYWQ